MVKGPQTARQPGRSQSSKAVVPPRRRAFRPWALGLAAAAVVVVAVLGVLGAGQDTPASAEPSIGGDLHSLVVDPTRPTRLYLGGHDAVAVSEDAGRSWLPVRTLDRADAMGWGFQETNAWVAGHNGLHRSTDGGQTFRTATIGMRSSDVHAFGAGSGMLYAASPTTGVSASSDDGTTWDVRSPTTGRSFFGRILVDPTDAEHLVAADPGSGPVESRDGGRTWARLGGVAAATWVSGFGGDPTRVVVSGPSGAARSSDAGRTWQPLTLPEGATIAEVGGSDAQLIYAAGLIANRARVWVSHDGGRTWARP